MFQAMVGKGKVRAGGQGKERQGRAREGKAGEGGGGRGQGMQGAGEAKQVSGQAASWTLQVSLQQAKSNREVNFK